MVEPTGYSALDLIGFTDKGDYAAGSTYVKNDIVHYGGNMWLCKLDDTTGQTPAEGTYWTLWLESDTTLASMTDTQISSPADGDVLEYNSTASKWKNSGTLKALKEALTNQINANGSKNVLPLNVPIGTYLGITVSKSENYWTLNGTASGSPTDFSLLSDKFDSITNVLVPIEQTGIDKTKTYIFSRSVKVSEVRYYIFLYNGSTQLGVVALNNDNGLNATLDMTQYSTTTHVAIGMRIGNGTVLSNSPVKPMLCLSSDFVESADYAPPAKTNYQLTKETTGLIDNQNVNGAVNVLPNTATSQVINGVTFTVNDDGTVTANGKATANAEFILLSYTNALANSLIEKIRNKAVKLVGCPSGGSGSTYHIRKWGQGSTGTYYDTGEGVVFTLSETSLSDNQWNFQIRIMSGTTVSNLTFKPMIAPASMDLNYDDYVPYAKSNRELTEETDVTLTLDTSNFSIVSYKIKKRDGHVYGYIDAKVVNVSGVSVGTLSEKPPYTWAQAACNSSHRAADNAVTVCYVNNQGVIAINPANAFTVDDRVQIAIDFYTSL